MISVDEALDLVEKLSGQLQARRGAIQADLDSYSGRHSLRFFSPEFGAYFAHRFAGFADNWCAPVIQATTERMNVLGIRLDSDDRRADEDLSRVWKRNNCEAESSQAFVVALAASRMFALVWGNPDDESTPRVTWEHPANCIVGYDADTGESIAALKWWQDDRYDYATLYTADQVFKFERRTGGGTIVLPATFRAGWDQRQPASDDTWPLKNPMGVVPMVEFRNQSLLDDKPISDIAGVSAMQGAINLTWAYLLNALDYATIPQRVMTGADVPKVPVLGSDGQVIGTRPVDLGEMLQERILWVSSKDAKPSEWSAANLTAFGDTIERAVEHISAQTRTPPHYLVGKIANLSADALTASETGQVAKARERVVYMTAPMRRLHSLIALAQGDEKKADLCLSGTVLWQDIQFRSLAQKADAFTKLQQIGFPFEWLAEQWGLGPDEVARVLQMRKDQAALDPIGRFTEVAGQRIGEQ